MGTEEFIPKAKELVAQYFNTKREKASDKFKANCPKIKDEEVYVVWYSKTLENSKALLSTPVSDGMYYEVTLNGGRSEIYFDAYKKESNTLVELKGELKGVS